MTTRDLQRAFRRAGGYIEVAGDKSDGWWYGGFVPSRKAVFWRSNGRDGEAFGWRIINRETSVGDVVLPDPKHRLAVSEVVNWARA